MNLHITKQKNRFVIDSVEIQVQNYKMLEVEQKDLTLSQDIGIHKNSLVTIKRYFQEIKTAMYQRKT